ncbi:MAG TPA: hypothetical protein DEP51_07010 [Clostridiales bacterium]|nr:hypothetical protein [Clostridiales bacterium]
MPGNGSFNNNPTNPNAVPKRRIKIKAPSKATMIKTGKYVLKGAAIALVVAMVGAHLGSSGINAVSKMDDLQPVATSLLTIAATIGMLPIAATIGLGNKLQGKNADFVRNVQGGVQLAGMLTTPAIQLLTSTIGLGSGIISKVTDKKITDKLAAAAKSL